MNYRLLAAMGALLWILSPPVSAQVSGAASKHATVPHTPDGHPSLEGVWTNVTLTPLERPDAFAGKLSVSDAEAAAYEKSEADDLKSEDGKSTGKLIDSAGSAGTGGYNVLFIDRGSELARVDGRKRTSLIIDPPDGKVPALTEQAKQMPGMNFERYDSIKDRPLSERCILGFGSISGPPMLPVLYNNNYQIVESPGYILIMIEMIHDVRVIPMDGRPHLPANVRLWMGDPRGHWEGDTLVVDSTNFTTKTHFRGADENLHLIEKFKQTDAETILYQFTVDDPTAFSKPWTAEIPLHRSAGPMYEFACHEGNVALPNMLRIARQAEQSQAPRSSK